MSALANLKQRLRGQSEEYLRLAALDELRRRHPEGTTEPFRRSGGIFWRRVFVPVYRVLPWSLKQAAMRLLGMTAKGWTPPARRTGEPWRPPAPGPGDRRNGT
ncbi:MAG: hypothetical protein ACXVYV_09735 [Gaiellales bacterium]